MCVKCILARLPMLDLAWAEAALQKGKAVGDSLWARRKPGWVPKLGKCGWQPWPARSSLTVTIFLWRTEKSHLHIKETLWSEVEAWRLHVCTQSIIRKPLLCLCDTQTRMWCRESQQWRREGIRREAQQLQKITLSWAEMGGHARSKRFYSSYHAMLTSPMDGFHSDSHSMEWWNQVEKQ